MEELDELLRLVTALNREGVDYVIIGGVALNVLGLIRTTEDVDLFVRPNDDNIERLRRALHSLWNDPEIDLITAEDLCGEYPAVRYGPPAGTLYLDILTRLGEFATYDDLEAQVVDVRGVPVRVATPKTLYWMKRDTVRPQDRADAEALRRAFDLEDEDAP